MTFVRVLLRLTISMRSTSRVGRDCTGPLVREVTDVIALLLDAGADPNKPTGTGRISLNIAMRSGQGDAVRLLLEAGADPEQADTDGKTPLMVGRAGKYPGLVAILREWGQQGPLSGERI